MPALTTYPARVFWPLLLAILLLALATVYLPYIMKPSFAVETHAVGVYWDPAHTDEVEAIDWGDLAPASTHTADVYVRNEEVAPSGYVAFYTDDWAPPEASQDLTLEWDYNNTRIPLDDTIPVTLTLDVAPTAQPKTFSFTMIIIGTAYRLGDLNHDDTVSIYDLVILANAYGTTATDTRWNPDADLNNDGIINITDTLLFAQNYAPFTRPP